MAEFGFPFVWNLLRCGLRHFLDDRILTECSRKLFCMLYGYKKEFDNFVMLNINKNFVMLFTLRYERKYVLKET